MNMSTNTVKQVTIEVTMIILPPFDMNSTSSFGIKVEVPVMIKVQCIPHYKSS